MLPSHGVYSKICGKLNGPHLESIGRRAAIDLVELHIDFAVRIGSLPDSMLVARRVGEIRWVVCASPDYLH